jgi:hypothetical protein
MSRMGAPPPARLVLSLLYRAPVGDAEPPYVARALESLTAELGPHDFQSPALSFDYTDYYTAEMGAPLERFFMSFSDLVARDRLVEIKHRTAAIEKTLSDEQGRRLVNIDPGLLTAESLVLATTKNYSHRIYLGQGVFAELTLVYRGGEYRPLEWTYPDYASDQVRSILGNIRELLMETPARLEPLL